MKLFGMKESLLWSIKVPFFFADRASNRLFLQVLETKKKMFDLFFCVAFFHLIRTEADLVRLPTLHTPPPHHRDECRPACWKTVYYRKKSTNGKDLLCGRRLKPKYSKPLDKYNEKSLSRLVFTATCCELTKAFKQTNIYRPT